MLTKYSFLKVRLILLLLAKGKLSLRKIANLVHCYIAYWRKLDRSGQTPFIINFELSNHCNESCVFCRSASGKIFDQNPKSTGEPIPKGTMRLEVFQDIVRQAKDTLLMAVPYVNGEPFIYKHLGQALRTAKECNVATMIASNGILLGEENIDKILDNDLDFIKVHISGYTNDVHQIQHRVGDVEVIKSNLKMLAGKIRERKARILVLVDYILYKHNVHQLDLFRNFAKECGFLFSVRPGNPRGMEDMEKAQPLRIQSTTHIPCDWLWKALTVNWNGDLLPCCDYVVWSSTSGYGEHKVGETDLLDLWNGPEVIGMRKTHRDQGRAPIAICSGCKRTGIEFKF